MQHKACNLLYANRIIKSCFIYSCNKHTGTSLTGSNQHNEPVNRVPKIGWASSTLPTKLGSANSGSMGTPNSGWLPIGATYQTRVPQPIHCSPESKLQITTEMLELLTKGVIVETQQLPHSFVSQLFLVEKKVGPVINLKCLNQFVKTEHFKMEGLHLLPDLLQPQDWMVKMDLKDTYLQIPIHPDYQNLHTFQWEEKTYKFQYLPFGLSTAPRVFTKLLKLVVGFLRQINCRLIIYLDDILLMHQERAYLEQITQLIGQLFKSLGLTVNRKKSILSPTQELGSVTMRLSMSSEKFCKIQQECYTRHQSQWGK